MDDRAQWDRIESIFHRALERESADRAEYIARECAGNEDVRRRVESLLNCDDGTSPIDRRAGGLACGITLGHYRLVSKLGEGGMGTVYLARDTLLDRDVAVKILIAEFKNDSERRRRFLAEAKAASGLNHPNIVTVHDAGAEGDLDYLVMEYVRGKPLDRLIPRSGLKLKEALRYAIQIADALACTHKAGIIHRDLKPANVLVTESGVAKVADFGIAKRVRAEMDGGTLTQQGAIFGSAAYMSPEQAEGKAVDARSDIFSFGSLLYEMVTGCRAFHRDTAASTLAAVLREEPEAVVDAPPQVGQVIEKCLRKNPADRFRSMDELRSALEEVKPHSDAVVPRKSRRWLLWPVTATLVAIGFAAVIFWYGKTSTPEPVLKSVPLTTYPGFEGNASFSPDGEQVVFSWCKEEGTPTWNTQYPNVCDIYIKQLGQEPSSRLTDTKVKNFSPAWSPDGKWIAFLRLTATKLSVVLIPQRGGRERVVVEDDLTRVSEEMPPGPHLAWTPDSSGLMCTRPVNTKWRLSLISVDSAASRALTPPSQTDSSDTGPAISPDGRTLFFSRRGPRYDLYRLALGVGSVPQGNPVKIASEPPNLGAAWLPDGSGVLFASGWLGENGLWRISVTSDRRPQRLTFAPSFAAEPAISVRGNRLAYTAYRRDVNIWRLDLTGPDGRVGTPKPVIASTKPDESPGCAPDGKRLAFTSWQSGWEELWLSSLDGSNLQQLTSLKGTINSIYGTQWSPDGQSIAVNVDGGLGIVSASSGVLRRLPVPDPPGGGKWPSWSRDGQWLYFASNVGDSTIWRVRPAGGTPVQITKGVDDDMPQASFDGKFIYFNRGWPRELSVWRIPVEGGEETKIIDGVSIAGQWTVGPNGIYYFATPDEKGRSEIRLYEFATRKTKKILTIEHSVVIRIAVSPDGRSIFYPQNEDQGSDLMLVENFH